jgi:hypothetical protein
MRPILILGTRWRWVVSVTPRPRFIPGKGPPVPIGWLAEWISELVWTQRLEEKRFAWGALPRGVTKGRSSRSWPYPVGGLAPRGMFWSTRPCMYKPEMLEIQVSPTPAGGGRFLGKLQGKILLARPNSEEGRRKWTSGGKECRLGKTWGVDWSNSRSTNGYRLT